MTTRDYRVVQVFENDSCDVTLWTSVGHEGCELYGVTYGKAQWWDMVYSDAAAKLGECLMHAANCMGLLDD